MKIVVGTDGQTLNNFRQALLKLRPRISYEGSNLMIRHKNTTFQLPLTLGVNSKGFNR